MCDKPSAGPGSLNSRDESDRIIPCPMPAVLALPSAVPSWNSNYRRNLIFPGGRPGRSMRLRFIGESSDARNPKYAFPSHGTISTRDPYFHEQYC